MIKLTPFDFNKELEEWAENLVHNLKQSKTLEDWLKHLPITKEEEDEYPLAKQAAEMKRSPLYKVL